MLKRRPKPSEVFTPRRADVNADMYISRDELEKKFRRALNGTQHIIVFGDSGSGKTWLYKSVFEQEDVSFKTVDLSVAVSEGLPMAILRCLPEEEWQEVKKSKVINGGLNVTIAKIEGQETLEFQRMHADAIDRLLDSFPQSKSGRNFIVFDNFEQISRDSALVSQIASLIIRLDNSTFSKKNVRFLFVGVVTDMKELVARQDHAGTIANRLTEIPEVMRLTKSEAMLLVRRGLVEKLKIQFEDEFLEIANKILFHTNQNAQQIHELCYQIACEAEENGWIISKKGFNIAVDDWISTSLSQHVAQIEARMNKRETKIQRRNQVLFCLGASDTNNIRASHIDQKIREVFPNTTSAEQLGVDQILAGLAEGSNPILLRNPSDSSYRLANPKLKLAIRARLRDLAPSVLSLKKIRDFSEGLEIILRAFAK